jgi:hypothetical protein
MYTEKLIGVVGIFDADLDESILTEPGVFVRTDPQPEYETITITTTNIKFKTLFTGNPPIPTNVMVSELLWNLTFI